MKKILFVVYHAPCGSIWPNEGFRTAFGMYGEDIEPEILFVEQGVVALAQETEPSKLGLLSLKMVQKYLDRFETKIYAEKESLDRYRVPALDDGYHAEVISQDQVADMIREKDFVIYM